MNYFIVNQKDRMIWADVPMPIAPPIPDYWTGSGVARQPYNDLFKEYEWAMDKYNSRPHYPYSAELNWIDGQRVEEGKDFQLYQDCKDDSCPPYDSFCFHCSRSQGCDAPFIAIPLPSKDKEEAADKYATIEVPAANPNDAPYTTTGDIFDYVHDAFIAGADWKESQLKDKEEKTDRMFTMSAEQLSKIWDSGFERAIEHGTAFSDLIKEQYFKEKFNIIL